MTPAETLSPDEKLARAQEAQRLLEHPLLKEAFANLTLNYFEAFSRCEPSDIHGRDQIFHAARVLSDVQTHLRIVMQQGKVEQAHVERMKRGKAA